MIKWAKKLFAKIDWHSQKMWGILGIIIAFLTFLLQPYLGLETQAKIWNQLRRNFIALITVLAILLLLGLIFRQYRKLKTLRKNIARTRLRAATRALSVRKLRSLQTKIASEEPPTFKRFEDFKNIKYGYVEYRPLLYYDVRRYPRGIGVTLLRLIFESENIQLVDVQWNSLWHDLIQKLANKQYDIIATPIFETRERSRLVSFCSPIFYSDIGMYVKKESGILGGLQKHSKSFKEAIEVAQRVRPKLVAIEGEVSGKMAKKYLIQHGSQVTEWLNPESGSVNTLIARLNDTTGSDCEVVFAETFQAEHTPPVLKGDVINVLRSKQLTYPVSFAVRRADYVLKNFINLKLFDIEKTVEGGVLGIILRELQQHQDYEDYTLDRVKEYFIRGLHPSPDTSTGGTDPANSQPSSEPDSGPDTQSGSVTSITERKRKVNGH